MRRSWIKYAPKCFYNKCQNPIWAVAGEDVLDTAFMCFDHAEDYRKKLKYDLVNVGNLWPKNISMTEHKRKDLEHELESLEHLLTE